MKRTSEWSEDKNNRITSKNWRLVICRKKIFPEGNRPEFRERLWRKRHSWSGRIMRKK